MKQKSEQTFVGIGTSGKLRLLKLIESNHKNKATKTDWVISFHAQVLELMREVTEEGEDEGHTSDLSPYHSDSDSAVMMSGNSPFISKAQRYNFLSRSVRLGSKHNVRASILASSLSQV